MSEEKNRFNLNEFEAIVFDWDGVLFDSFAAIAKSCVDLCALHGVNITEDYYHQNYLRPNLDFYSELGINLETEEEMQEFREKYWQLYEKHCLTSSLFPEVPSVLRKLKGRLKMGIVSASMQEVIHENLFAYGLKDLFSDADVYARRHDKVEDIVNFYTKHSLNPNKVIILGDLPSDIENGKKAGIKTGGVVRNIELKKKLLPFEPDYIFEDLNQLF